MTVAEKMVFKQQLFLQAAAILEQRIATTVTAMHNAQRAANEEEKSSAGDKYETSRAMSHLDKDMYARQSEANKKELLMLQTVNVERIYDRPIAGSVIRFESFFFFIAVGIGRIVFNDQPGFMLSAAAPLAASLLDKKKGEMIYFDKANLQILDIF